MDHPCSRPVPPPTWSDDQIANTNPDRYEEEGQELEEDEAESTDDDDDKEDGREIKRSVSQLDCRPPKKKRIVGLNVRDQTSPPKSCQVQNCTEDLTGFKQYHRRHKICAYHAKALFAIVAGLRQRFCQQCSRFHELHEFDDKKRSCRRRLAGHNERRRRMCTQLKGNQFIHEGERGRG